MEKMDVQLWAFWYWCELYIEDPFIIHFIIVMN